MTTTIQREGREDVKYNNGNLTLVQKPQLLANAGMLEEECRFEICTTDFWADAQKNGTFGSNVEVVVQDCPERPELLEMCFEKQAAAPSLAMDIEEQTVAVATLYLTRENAGKTADLLNRMRALT